MFLESTEGGGLVDINDGPDAVLAAASKLVANKEALLAGETDEAGPGDETFQITIGSVPARSLEPTQSQIGTGQSLLDQAGDKYGNLDRAIAGGRLGSASGEFPILVFGNKVLDGHHRWSQFITTNPDAMVDVARLEAPGIKDADGALGLAHFINIALYGKSPTKAFQGENVYGMNKESIKEMALENMADTTPPKLHAAGLIDEPTHEAAAEHFANNLSKIAGPGKHPRTSMPQAADAGDPSGMTQTPPEASTGAINYMNPKITDVRSEGRMKITKRQLRRIIKEERDRLLKEMHPRAAADNAYMEVLEATDELMAALRSTNLGVDMGREDDELYIMTGAAEGITVKVLRRGR